MRFVEGIGQPAWECAGPVHEADAKEQALEPLPCLLAAGSWTDSQPDSVRFWCTEPEGPERIVYGLRPDLAPEPLVARLGWLCVAAEAKYRGDPKPPASELAAAAAKGNQPAVRRLLLVGGEIDWRASDGAHRDSTALVVAARLGLLDMCRFLIEMGANVDTKGFGFLRCDGWSPLAVAAEQGHRTIVEFLLEAGVNVDAKSVCGGTALYWAAREGHPAVVTALVRAGAKLELRGAEGDTALTEAAYNGHAAVVAVLLRAGADANACDDHAYTALMSAALQGHHVVAEQLAVAGAYINAETYGEHTALILAARGDHPRVVAILVSAGADLDMTDGNDRCETALQSARRLGHDDCARILEAMAMRRKRMAMRRKRRRRRRSRARMRRRRTQLL